MLKMLENIVVAITNLVGLLGLHLCQTRREYRALLMAVLSSTVYHLVEHHKHGMPGVSNIHLLACLSNPIFHQIFLNLDRICAIYCFYVFFRWEALYHPYIVLELTLGLAMMFMAENVFTGTDVNSRMLYVITHSVWHLTAYLTLIDVKLLDH